MIFVVFQSMCQPTNEMLSHRLQSVLQEQLDANYMDTSLKLLGLTVHDILFVSEVTLIWPSLEQV